MKTKYLFDPLALFLIPSIFSVLTWVLTPVQWFNEWKITYKVEPGYVLFPWILGFLVFSAGSVVRRITYRPACSYADSSPNSARNVQWLTFLFASVSVFALVLLVSRSGLSGLFNTYIVRSNYVGGITTFSLLTTAGIAFAGVNILIDGNLRRVAIIPLVGVSLFAIYRVVVGAERIALFIPLIAIASVFLLRRFKYVHFKLFFYVLVTLFAVLAFFVCAEYFRSYSAKMDYGEDINTSFIEYGLQRFVLYFSASVNAGGAMFSFFETGVSNAPLFTTTFSPFAKVLYSNLGLAPIVFGPFTGADVSDIAINMGLFNPEFNNHWGVATPFTEGWGVGVLFWFIWGFVGTHLYLNVVERQGDAWDWSFWGLFVAAFLDNQSRVALLAAPHFLVPFLWLYLLSVFRTKVPIFNQKVSKPGHSNLGGTLRRSRD
jgi:hypothetical protein